MPDDIGASRGRYFLGAERQMEFHLAAFGVLGEAIAERKYVYHRGAFYADVALMINLLLEHNLPPFNASGYNWEWWANELEARAEDLGMDAQYAMNLPAPFTNSAEDWQKMFSRLDLLWRYLPGIYEQEERDSQVSQMGPITAAECVKITARFAGWLEKWCYTIGVPGRPFAKVTWPWLDQVQKELNELYKSLGEDSVAGGWGPGGGPIPPISWPGA